MGCEWCERCTYRDRKSRLNHVEPFDGVATCSGKYLRDAFLKRGLKAWKLSILAGIDIGPDSDWRS